MPSENELEIILSLQDRVTKEFEAVTKKIKAGTQDIEKETDKLGKTSDKTNQGMVKGVREQIQPINLLLRTITRVGFIWGATFGLMIKSVIDLGKETQTLDLLSIKLGISASDLSMRFYGLNIATEEMKLGTASLQNVGGKLGDTWRNLGVETAYLIGQNAILLKQFSNLVRDAASGQLTSASITPRSTAIAQIQAEALARRIASKEGQQIWVEENNLFNQLSLSKVDYTRKQFDDMLGLARYYGVSEEELQLTQEAFSNRVSQDEEMEYDRLQSEILTATGDTTMALAFDLDKRLILYKRSWGENEKLIDLFLQKEKLAAEQAKWKEIAQQIGQVGGALGSLGSAMTTYAGENKKLAKAAAAVTLASAIATGAEAVINGLATKPFFPLGIIMGALAAALVGVQIATISSQSFASGGRPPLGQASLVGERGPELFMPDTAGTIIPNNLLKGFVMERTGGNFDMPTFIGKYIDNRLNESLTAPSTQVSNRLSQRLSASGGFMTNDMGNQTSIHIEIYNPVVRSDEDIDRLTEEVSQRLAREAERL
jgi:hypothetical protein